MSDPSNFMEAPSPGAVSDQTELQAAGRQFFQASVAAKYSYRFSWLGRPLIQYPQDLLAIQELIWSTRPDLIVETGVAHGGSLVFYASMLELLGEEGRALGIELDLRPENRREIDLHPLRKRISLIEGCSVDAAVLTQVARFAQAASGVLVVLDSNHTHEHVLRELHAYSPLVTLGSYLIVLDTAIEQLPEDTYPNRPWGRGNNPHTAVRSFLQQNSRFEVDRSVDKKIVISVAPGGYLRRIAEEPSPSDPFVTTVNDRS